jgi:hypothetical protein
VFSKTDLIAWVESEHLIRPRSSDPEILPAASAWQQGQLQHLGELLHLNRAIGKAARIAVIGKAISENYKMIKRGLLFSRTTATAQS